MQILILSREYAPDGIAGGIGSHLRGFAPALVERGHEVHVLSCVPDQERRDVVQEGVHVHRRGTVRLRGLSRLLGSPRGALRLRTAISCALELRRLGIDPDVVHVPDWMAEGLLVGLAGRRPVVANLATPLHMTVRHNGQAMSWDARFADRLERTAVRRATAVATTSNLLARELRDWVGGDRDVRIIPPPVALDHWDGVGPAEATGPVLLAVGRIEHRKAPDVIVEAAGRLAAEVPGLELVLAGRGEGERDGRPYDEWLAARAEALGVRCTFAGQVPRDGLPELFSRARVVLVPSRFDSFSVTALEGMAAGRPVICSTTTGAGELLGDHPELLVPPEDPAALAAACRPFLLDAGEAARVGAELRDLVARTCSSARIAELREELYTAAIAAHDRRRHLRSG